MGKFDDTGSNKLKLSEKQRDAASVDNHCDLRHVLSGAYRFSVNSSDGDSNAQLYDTNG